MVKNSSEQQYLDLCRHILANGVDKSDRTGTGTKSVFGYQMRFNLADGFPLLTTKRIAWNSVAHELLWFLRGDTNVAYLQQNAVTIWNDWRRPYSFKREIVLIEPMLRQYEPYSGDFTPEGIEELTGVTDSKLVSIWKHMMRRCYDSSAHNYGTYGGKGVSVEKDWHHCGTFLREVKTLPHWAYKEGDWNTFELDKDYFGANQYGKHTTVWLHTGENNYYTSSAKPVQVTTEEGSSELFITLSEAARTIGMPTSTLSRFINFGLPSVLKGANKTFVGWEFSEADTGGKLARLQLIDPLDLGPIYSKQWRNWEGIDQIAEVIETIRTNPDSRRMIVNAWNVGEIDQMALPPCHFAFQFYVANGKLSCQLYQRSGDVFLGIPFNIASYALLTHMMAHVTGLEVGEFVHTIGDAHIYTNHIDKVQEQLTRAPREMPSLTITGDTEDIDSIGMDDIILEGYDPHPKIRGKVAV